MFSPRTPTVGGEQQVSSFSGKFCEKDEMVGSSTKDGFVWIGRGGGGLNHARKGCGSSITTASSRRMWSMGKIDQEIIGHIGIKPL